MKTWKIAAIAVGVLVLAGCGSKPTVENNETQNQEINSSGIISSIQDAITSGQAMKCTYATIDENGGEFMATTYVEGKKYKSETETTETVQRAIFDGETMYSWSEKQKQGMKIDKNCAEELKKSAPQESVTQIPDASGEKTFDSAVNAECAPAGKIDFSIPEDVTFVDQCKMLKDLMKNIPSVPNIPNIPQLP